MYILHLCVPVVNFREKVYEILTQNDIEVPHYGILKRPNEQDIGGK